MAVIGVLELSTAMVLNCGKYSADGWPFSSRPLKMASLVPSPYRNTRLSDSPLYSSEKRIPVTLARSPVPFLHVKMIVFTPFGGALSKVTVPAVVSAAQVMSVPSTAITSSMLFSGSWNTVDSPSGEYSALRFPVSILLPSRRVPPPVGGAPVFTMGIYPSTSAGAPFPSQE